MFKKHKSSHKRSNPFFGLFRLLLSLSILAVLVGGVYSAYRQFSGADPLKLSPRALMANFVSADKLIDLGISLLSLDPKKIQVNSGQLIVNSEKGKDEIGKLEGEDSVLSEEAKSSKASAKSALSFKFAIVTDSHNENKYLEKAINQAKEAGAKFIIGLGDYTEVGTINELNEAKKAFDSGAIRYFVTSGDHDLWDSRDKSKQPQANFTETFGRTFQAFAYGQVRLVVLDNSDNYKGIEQSQMNFLQEELSKAKNDPEIKSILVFMHEPMYHPSSDRVMGKITESLKKQSKDIIKLLKASNVKGVFAGDIHYFTKYQEPETNLNMVTVGALTSLRNAQSPRFGMVSIFENGSWEIEDIEVR